MEYRCIGNRCAVDFSSLQLPISRDEALVMLNQLGFRLLDVDVCTLARECIGTSQYRRGARPSEAPGVVDCSSFIKWLYGKRGIWLPRRSIQQRQFGESVDLDQVIHGDVIFVSGFINYYYNDQAQGVGHVGIVTENGTVIHAASKKDNVIETSLDQFIYPAKFRGARRYIPRDAEVLTLEAPLNREVEVADDIRWIILQQLSI